MLSKGHIQVALRVRILNSPQMVFARLSMPVATGFEWLLHYILRLGSSPPSARQTAPSQGSEVLANRNSQVGFRDPKTDK